MSDDLQHVRERQAWLIRAGRNGERESRALQEGLAILGWSEVGDLSKYRTWHELKSALQQAYSDAGRAVIGNWTGQLWKFDSEIQHGDLVVMPLKTRPGYLAVGRVSGPYEYREDEPRDFRQVRKVDWLRTDISWDAVRPDLRASLGSLLTVCGLARHNAAARIEHLADHGTDPGFDGDEEATSSTELLDDAVSRDPSNPRALTIRSLLEHWGVERRTAAAVSMIKADLASNGLTTRPAFTEGALSDIVALVPLGTEPGTAAAVTGAVEDIENVTEPEPMSRRLGSLPARLVSVPSSVDLTYAKTLMLQHQFSQVAVIDEDGTYHGAVTWESIGQAHIASDDPTLTNATVPALVVDHDALLLDQIDMIYDRGFIFVRDQDRVRVTGILTASDLTRQFGTLARPFVLIEEAENRLRRSADEHFDLQDLKDSVPSYQKSRIKDASDLTFGNYVYLLRDADRWRKLGWRLDQDQVIDLLEKVKDVRNDLMHFATDPLSEEKFAAVTGLLQLLRTAEPNP
ncbi:CBS domain-containing protein [Nocardia amamiensis]|uniref:CBS domain-containing protein n=1 Tax=Nocardia amamiensis TaxID=404578 RepID=UPI000A013445|nr:CBS domain-containing protein [Nocardia amamiensis]